MLFNEALERGSHCLQNLSWLQNLIFFFYPLAAIRKILNLVKNVLWPDEGNSSQCAAGLLL